MKSAALQKFRAALAEGRTQFGLWITLESPSITEMAVGLGLDWVVIDAEHGHLDWKEIVEHLRATVRSDTVALVRIAELNGGLIKRALDVGADGIVVPWIESADQLERAIAYSKYPLDGLRGIGAERATCWGQCLAEHTSTANEDVLVIPIIETVSGVREASKLAQVPGSEVFFFGPADLSASSGARGAWEGPGVAEEILRVKDLLRQAGKQCGLIATGNDNLIQRQDQGFRMLGIGIDSALLHRSLQSTLSAVGRSRQLRASLQPDSVIPAKPLDRPPESLRPDRSEVMCSVGTGQNVELARGVEFECLVGKHNQARQLTTGIVTFAPLAKLPAHHHTFAESITLLSGESIIEVAGRAYTLRRLDNVVIPAGLVHTARNVSAKSSAVFHIALATSEPTRVLSDQFFTRRVMPDDSTGTPGAERVTRFASARRFAAGPNTEFIDCFNAALMPGLEMSGGYGWFAPGGRLPAHVHPFDESICIISGLATCVVEGRHYSIEDCGTALQPRGRVHYFINQSNAPMEMLWVYAGPMPERIVVDEVCSTVAGNPWKD